MTEQEIRAYDLGEDGEMWMVEGTRDPEVAKKAVYALWDEQGVADEYAENVVQDALDCAPGDSWWWEPVNPSEPDDEALLRHDERPEGVEPFVGVLVRL